MNTVKYCRVDIFNFFIRNREKKINNTFSGTYDHLGGGIHLYNQ